ncbi:MAG: hypothetical protein JRF63_09235 [Deltaproteobacteria bacterium]|nr:hypothetical protein [Deltaproteobacteria bacterium]
MNDIKLEWITRIETPSDTVIYLSPTRRQLFLANRRLDAGGEPLAAVDLAKPLSGELPELIDLTKWYMTEHVKADDPSFVPVFDFGHQAVATILGGKHSMVGVGVVGTPEVLLSNEDYQAGRATAIAAGGGAELLPISADLGALVEGHDISHLVLVLAVDPPNQDASDA